MRRVKWLKGNLHALIRRWFRLTRVYHISPDGDDVFNDGTLEYPWKTLHRAHQATKPGDTICLLPGKYQQALHIEQDNK